MRRHEWAVSIFNRFCKQTQTVIYYPQPNHICDGSCRFYEIKTKDHHMFVCKFSRCVHDCGKECKTTELLPNREGYTCKLTGHVIDIEILENYTKMSKVTPQKRLDSSHGNYLDIGIKCKRTLYQIKTHNSARKLEAIKSVIVSIMSGVKRKQYHDGYKKRFMDGATKIFKSHKTTKIDFAAIDLKLASLMWPFKKSLNPPIEIIDKRFLDRLANGLLKYFELVCATSDSTIANTPQQVAVYTASMCTHFSTGYAIGDVAIIPKIEWFAQHSAPEIDYKYFGENCNKAITGFNRRFRKLCISKKSGRVLYEMIFNADELFATASKPQHRKLGTL